MCASLIGVYQDAEQKHDPSKQCLGNIWEKSVKVAIANWFHSLLPSISNYKWKVFSNFLTDSFFYSFQFESVIWAFHPAAALKLMVWFFQTWLLGMYKFKANTAQNILLLLDGGALVPFACQFLALLETKSSFQIDASKN